MNSPPTGQSVDYSCLAVGQTVLGVWAGVVIVGGMRSAREMLFNARVAILRIPVGENADQEA